MTETGFQYPWKYNIAVPPPINPAIAIAVVRPTVSTIPILNIVSIVTIDFLYYSYCQS